MQIASTNSTTNTLLSGSTSSSSSSSPTGTSAASFQSLLSELNVYAKADPAQSMMNEILAQLGITPQQLQAMTPEEREKVMQKVEDLIKKDLKAQEQAQSQQSTTSLTALSSTASVSSASLSQSAVTAAQPGSQAHTYHAQQKGTTIDFTL